MKTISLLLFLALACASAQAAPPDAAAIATLYARALGGDKEAVLETIAALDQVLAARPNDQLARVYLGSAWTLRSRDLPFGLTKWSALQRGFALMDEAAAAAPANARVQLLRAVTNEAMPALLGRRALARGALETLVAQLEKNRALLSVADQQLLYLNAGEAAAQAGEKARARLLWQRGAALAADPRLSAEIRQALAAAQ